MTASSLSIEDLYRDRYPAFVRVAASVTGDRESARDAVQEGFARALSSRRSFRGDAPLQGWVWRIVINAALDQRRAGLSQDLGLDDASVGIALPDPGRDPQLAEALRALSPRRRLVVFLRYFADLTYEEIAVAADISPGTVAATLNRSHALLADALGSGQGVGG